METTDPQTPETTPKDGQPAAPQKETPPQAPEEKPAAAAQEKKKDAPETPEAPPADAPSLPLKTKPEGLLGRMFDRETRWGRFNRALLRWVTTIAVLFALGVLTAFFVLVKPLRSQLADAQGSLQQTQSELDGARSQMDALQRQKSALETDLQTSQDALELATLQINYLNVKTNLLKARLALKSPAGGPDALEALKQAQADLELLLPFVNQQDPNLATLLKSRLEVAVAEVKRDPVEAPQSVDDAYTRLLDLEQFLFP